MAGPDTVPFDPARPEAALVAVADRVLAPMQLLALEDYITFDDAIEDALSRHSGGERPSLSGLLQFRRLQLVDMAARRHDLTPGSPPLPSSLPDWLARHQERLVYFEPGDDWFVPPERYWDLFEAHREAPWAEDAAWAAVTAMVPADECYEVCVLDRLARTYARYWSSFPRGAFVEAALSAAIPAAGYAASLGCLDRGAPRLPALVGQLRASLAAVVSDRREMLLRHLAALDGACRS